MRRTVPAHSHHVRAAVLVVLLVTLAACGGYGGGGSSTKGSGSGSSLPGLKVASTSLGKVIVDARGMTVYLLTSDKPGTSLCSASCLSVWPPVPALAGKAKPAGVTATVGSTADTSGRRMATVGGWPLYTFAQDHAPGDVNGQGIKSFGGTWWAVSPSGQAVTGAGGAGY